jgi:hypothetical protein
MLPGYDLDRGMVKEVIRLAATTMHRKTVLKLMEIIFRLNKCDIRSEGYLDHALRQANLKLLLFKIDYKSISLQEAEKSIKDLDFLPELSLSNLSHISNGLSIIR